MPVYYDYEKSKMYGGARYTRISDLVTEKAKEDIKKMGIKGL